VCSSDLTFASLVIDGLANAPITWSPYDASTAVA